MGMRDKKRNQKRVLARRTAAPRAGEGKDFLVRGLIRLPLPSPYQIKEAPNSALILMCCFVLVSAGGRRSEEEAAEAEGTQGAGEHCHRSLHRAHPPRVL
jgi:hypothetical protein